MFKRSISVLLSLVLIACASSPPSNLYVLTANSRSQQNISEPYADKNKQISVVGVLPVSIPEYLHRDHIVYTDTSNRLVFSANERWSEPLDKAVARVLTMNFSKMGQEQKVVDFPWRTENRPDLTLQVTIRELDRRSPQAAVLNADWSLVNVDTKQVIKRDDFEQIYRMSQFDYAALAHAYSELLAQLSSEVQHALNTLDSQ